MVKKLLLFLVALTPRLPAQWTPVHAEKLVTETITMDDGTIKKTSIASEYFRSKSGSELIVTEPEAALGVVHPRTAKLYDSDGPAEYSLDYGVHRAQLLRRLPAPKQFRFRSESEMAGFSHQVIEGIDCVMLPIRMYDKRIGTAWVDVKDDLVIRSEARIHIEGSKNTTYRVEQLSHIDLAFRPVASDFHIPPNFTY